MFKFLKEKLKKAVSKFSKKVEEEADIKEEEKVVEVKEEVVPKEPVKEVKKDKVEEVKEKPKVKKEVKEEIVKEPEEEIKEEPVEEVKEEPKEVEEEKEEPEEEEKEVTQEPEEKPEPEPVPPEEEVKAEVKEEAKEEPIKEEKEEVKEEPVEEEKKEPSLLARNARAEKKEKPKKSFFKKLFGKKEKKEEEVKPEKKEEVKEEVKKEPEVKEEKEVAAGAVPKVEVKEEEPEVEVKEKKGLFRKIKERFTTVKLSEDKFEKLFWELEVVLLENNVAVEVIDKIKADLKTDLTTGKVSRKGVYDLILESLRESVESLFMDQHFNIIKEIKNKKEKPYVIAFIGVNGSGKTTTMAKIAHILLENKLSVVFAASDTFRAAAIQQLEEHANKLGVKMIKHEYESDPAAVAYDAIEHAKAKNIDVVMIDTAGRLHSNDNLMNELKKLVRVNNPDL
ncbi:signal recognition particle receptor subunit alpha, partial [Candidatus Woesearchaeota archaeon]|nr:signal recognition particle receptor subunit alpha [Candidatus Woesearchaeota archaeon]